MQINIRLDGPLFNDHQACLDGLFQPIEIARLLPWPDTTIGEQGDNAPPEQQAERIASSHARHPRRKRWVFLSGLASPILDCGLRYGSGGADGPTAEEVLRAFERGVVDITRKDAQGFDQLDWLERFFARLDRLGAGLDLIHTDVEQGWGYWYFVGAPASRHSERTRALELINGSTRARRNIGEDYDAMLRPQAPVAGVDFQLLVNRFNRYGNALAANAEAALLEAAGAPDVPIAAFGYWQGDEDTKDHNGWPITSTPPDRMTGCYGAYGPGATVDAFAARLATRGKRGAAHQIIELDAGDPPTKTAARIATLDALGCTDCILWAYPGDQHPQAQIHAHLTQIAAGLRER